MSFFEISDIYNRLYMTILRRLLLRKREEQYHWSLISFFLRRCRLTNIIDKDKNQKDILIMVSDYNRRESKKLLFVERECIR